MIKFLILLTFFSIFLSLNIEIIEGEAFCFEENIPKNYVFSLNFQNQFIHYESKDINKRIDLTVKFKSEIFYKA